MFTVACRAFAAGLLSAAIGTGSVCLAADTPARLDLSAPASLKNRLFFFGGIDIASSSQFAWSGLVGSPTGLLHEDGLRLRAAGGLGRYKYETDAVPGGENEGHVTSGELMIGYRRDLGGVIVSSFVGLHAENQRLSSPDPGNEAQGTAFGVKAAIETFARLHPEWTLVTSAAASTVHRSYHARAAVAREFPSGFALGAEALIHGDVRYREPRVGLFAQATFNRAVLSLAGGYLDNSDKGGGAYATLSIYAPY
jgi:hypothetical protein